MKHLGLALLSGTLLAISWPTYGIPVILFVAFVPLLFIISHSILHHKKYNGWRVLGWSYIAFFIWNFFTTNWLQYADAFGAAFAVLVNSLLMSLVILIYYKIAKRTTQARSLTFLVALWLCFEKLHLGWEFSWPWLNLGNAFSEYTSWIQWYEYTGTFGGSLWVWLVNVFVFLLISNYKSLTASARKKYAIGIGLLLVFPVSASYIILNSYQNQGETIEVIALQPNIDPYSEKYNLSNEAIADLLLELSRQEITENTALILAPETVFADNVRLNLFNRLEFKLKLDSFLAENPHINFLTGVSFIEFIYDRKKVSIKSNQLRDNVWYNDFNSAVMLSNGMSPQLYHKSKLVVGVEDFPYQSVLKPLIGDAMIDLGGTVAMKTTQNYRSVFNTNFTNLRVAPIICYESVYGEFVTEYSRNGANLLAIITNDAWWNNTEGHRQHLSYAKLRAIENRRFVARSANTGISAIIDDTGKILNSLEYDKQGALKGEVKTNSKLTFYAMAGDYIARIAMFVALFVFMIVMFRKKRVKV
jgi:apolipoprotein N-acyltransferase